MKFINTKFHKIYVVKSRKAKSFGVT